MELLRLVTAVLILLGASAMALSILKTRQLLGLLSQNRYSPRWRVLLFLMLFFLLGYAGSFGMVLAGLERWVLVLSGVVFFFGALFVYLVVRLGSTTIGDLLNQSNTIARMMDESKQSQAQLFESEQRFRLIAENAIDLIAIVDRNGNRIYNSPSYEAILGYTVEELRATPPFEQIIPEDRDKVFQAAQQTLATGKSQTVEYRMRHKSGSVRTLESIHSAIRDDQGQVEHLVIISRDITERRKASEEQQQAEALRQQNEYLGALHATALGLLRRHDVNDLLQTIVTRAGALVGTEHGYVFWRAPDSSEYEMRVGVGVYSKLVGTRARPGIGLAGTVLAMGEPLAVPDYQNWSQRLRDPGRDVLRAVVGVPLKSGYDTVGVIGLAHTQEGRTFGLAEVSALTRFAELASLALDNAQLYDKVQQELGERRRAEQERALTEKFLDSVIDNLPIMLFTKEAKELRFVRWNKFGAELVGFSNEDMLGKNDADLFPADQAQWFMTKDREVLNGKALYDIPEEPIQTKSHGLRYLHTRKIPILNDKGEPEYLLGISEDITERRAAEQSSRRQSAYLAALHETSIALMQRLDSAELLRRIITRAGDLVGAEHGYIYLQVPGTDRVEMQVGVGVYEGLIGAQLKAGVGLAGKVWESGQTLVVDDYQTWPHRLPSSNRNVLRAASGVPLQVGGHIIGVIGLASLDADYRFGAVEVQVLTQFAELASVALDNARLFEQTQASLESTRRQAEREGRVAQISDRIYGTTDVKGILRIAASELRKTTGSSRAVIRLTRKQPAEEAVVSPTVEEPQ